jgi:large subunit ribosomal protein L10
MKLSKKEKVEGSKQLAETIKASGSLYFAGFQGLKFVELADLRAQLRPQKGTCRVIKNSLLEYALKQAGVEGGSADLTAGPNALVLGKTDDPVGVAKVLSKFAKDFPNLKLKAAFVGGKWLTGADVQKLSQIGSRPELLAKLAGALYSATAQSASVLAAPIRDFVLVLKALEEKKKTGAAA